MSRNGARGPLSPGPSSGVSSRHGLKEYAVRAFGGFRVPHDRLLEQLQKAMNEAARQGWRPLHVVVESPSGYYTVVFERQAI